MLEAFILIVIHYIADFMFQTEDMATGKSKNIKKLLKHTFIYTFTFFDVFVIYVFYQRFILLNEINPTLLWFFPITFVCHTVIDYISSKITSKKFEKKEFYTGIPNMGAFSIIGFDQVAHYATLFLTYNFLTN